MSSARVPSLPLDPELSSPSFSQAPENMPESVARIILGKGGVYELSLSDGSRARASLRGVFRHRKERPTLGDLVRIEATQDPLVPYVVTGILPRKNLLPRPQIANVDHMLIMMSLVQPDLDCFFLDKLIALSLWAQIEITLVLSKVDLLDSKMREARMRELAAEYGPSGLGLLLLAQKGDQQSFYLPPYQVDSKAELAFELEEKMRDHADWAPAFAIYDEPHLSAETKQALRQALGRRSLIQARSWEALSYEAVKQLFQDQIAKGILAISGSSGAGKSTLFNALIGEEKMSTGEVSTKLKKGRNTTRHIELHAVFDSWIADTPGFEKLELEQNVMQEEQLVLAYPEMKGFDELCRFTPCRHMGEPDCAVKLCSGIHPNRHYRYGVLREMIASHKNWR